MTGNKISLNCNHFETNMILALRDLREEKDFFDVTIVCEDSQIQAHKVILSACSTFFRNLLRRNPHQHPLLYLKGVKYKEILSILNFMYNGEISIPQEELKQFMAVAADLKVKGLAQKMTVQTPPTVANIKSPILNTSPQTPTLFSQKRESSGHQPTQKRLRSTPVNIVKQVHTPVKIYKQDVDDDILEVVPVQPVVKEKMKPTIFQSQSPRSIRQFTTPTPKILEQCILDAGINTKQPEKKYPEVIKEQPNKMVTQTTRTGKPQVSYPNNGEISND